MKRNKVVYGLVTALFLTMILPITAWANVTDVPTDHWAYHAVNSAVTRGYLTVFEDGTFQGSRAVDRYSLANVINRLLEDIEVSRVRGTSGDLAEISEFRIRFEEDLATWYADQQSLRDEVKMIDDKAKAAEDRVNRIVSAQVELEEQVLGIQHGMVGLQDGLTEVQAGIVSLQLAMGETMDRSESELRLTENELHLNELIQAVIGQERKVPALLVYKPPTVR